MSVGEEIGTEQAAPPAGEDIHLPEPTLLPFVTAIAITLIVVGTTLGWAFSIVGLVILIGAVVTWIRDTRRGVEALPEQHR